MSDAALDREASVLPHNIELEQTLLGAILSMPENMEKVSGRLRPEHFFAYHHQRIYELCEMLFERDRSVTVMTVAAHLSEAEASAWEEIGGRSYLARLASVAGMPRYMGENVEDLIEYWRRRELLRSIDEVAPAIADMSQSFDAAADVIEEVASGLRTAGKKVDTIRPVGDAVSSALIKANEAAKRGTGLTGISTGLTDLDRMTGGLAAADMIVIAGRPSMGKTTLAVCLARNVNRQGYGVVYVTPEMTGEEIGFRILTEEAARRGERIEYSDLKKGRFGDATRRMLADCADALRDEPMLIEEAGHVTMAALRGLVKKASRKFEKDGTPLGLVVIDHIGLVTVPGAKTDFEKISTVSGQTKQFAKSFGVPILALSQLSRQVESRDDKRPQLSDLRQSGNIEQDADIVMFPYRHEYYLERSKPETFKSPADQADWEADFSRWRNICEVGIAKQRNGPIGRLKLFCDMGTSSFTDLHRRDERQEAML